MLPGQCPSEEIEEVMVKKRLELESAKLGKSLGGCEEIYIGEKSTVEEI